MFKVGILIYAVFLAVNLATRNETIPWWVAVSPLYAYVLGLAFLSATIALVSLLTKILKNDIKEDTKEDVEQVIVAATETIKIVKKDLNVNPPTKE